MDAQSAGSEHLVRAPALVASGGNHHMSEETYANDGDAETDDRQRQVGSGPVEATWNETIRVGCPRSTAIASFAAPLSHLSA